MNHDNHDNPIQYLSYTVGGTVHTAAREIAMGEAFRQGAHRTLRPSTADEIAIATGARTPSPVNYTAAPEPEPETVKAGTVKASRAERIAGDVAFLAAQGWAARVPKTWFPPGTEMLQIGKSTFRSKAQLHADLPPAHDVLTAGIRQVQAENRKRRDFDAGALRLTDDGRLFREGSGHTPIPVEPRALWTLLSRFGRAFPGARALLTTVDPDVRAQVVNRQLQRLDSYGYSDDDRAVSLGFRTMGDQLQVYRATSTSYLDIPLDRVLTNYLQGINDLSLPDARAVLDYNPATTDATIRVSWHAPETFDAGVGDIFEVGLHGRTNDAGGGAHTVGLGFTRVLCINCTVADWAEGEKRRRHRGSKHRDMRAAAAQRVYQDIQRTASQAGTAAAHFLDSWGVLRAASAVDVGVDPSNPEPGLSKVRRLLSDAVARDLTVERLLTAWKAEPGDTAADVLNAVSRAAHGDLLTDIQRWRAEREAGALQLVLARRVS